MNRIHLANGYPNDSFINLHLTKNTEDSKNKPQIKIIRISKEDAVKHSDRMTKRMLSSILKPFDISDFKRRNRNKVGFLSYDSLKEGEDGKIMESKLKEVFMPITKTKKSRVKVKGDVGGVLEDLSTSRDYLKKVKKILDRIPKRFKNPIEGGTLVSPKESISVIRLGDQWFEVSTQDEFSGLIGMITNKQISTVV